MTQKHTETYRIRHDECDAYGVLNNTAYLRLAQETAWRHSIAAGFGYEYYEDLQRAWVARDSSIEYIRPVTYGNVLAVTTYIPSGAPEGYTVWPLWYVSWAFYHNKRAGLLFVVGLLLNLLVPLSF